jgi:hypothetical protein
MDCIIIFECIKFNCKRRKNSSYSCCLDSSYPSELVFLSPLKVIAFELAEDEQENHLQLHYLTAFAQDENENGNVPQFQYHLCASLPLLGHHFGRAYKNPLHG